jgi:medium-chain acyl-[acyl-carrier-protein] hydrolase
VPAATHEVVCFPHAGGASSTFRTWHAHATSVRVTAALLPGREARIGESPATDMGRLVPLLANAMRPLTARPYAFYGHSLGALVAFELTRELRARELPLPAALFVAGRDAPQYPDAEKVHHLPDAELLDRLRAWEGLDEDDEPDLPQYDELLALMLPTIRADMTLAETYEHRAQSPLPVPVHVLRGTADPLVRPGDGGWSAQTSAGCTVTEFPGGHFFVSDHERAIVRFVETALGDAHTEQERNR